MEFIKVLRDINLFDKMAGNGKMKVYDELEKTATRYLIPSESFKDFFDKKYSIKKLIIQWIIVIVIWIAPIKWPIELIAYRIGYDYHVTGYYTSYFGRAFGEDEISFTTLGILLVFSGNYYHLIRMLIMLIMLIILI